MLVHVVPDVECEDAIMLCCPCGQGSKVFGYYRGKDGCLGLFDDAAYGE